MTAYNESLGPPFIWKILFAFVFLEYLNSYICFMFFTIIFFFFFTIFYPGWLSVITRNNIIWNKICENKLISKQTMPINISQCR